MATVHPEETAVWPVWKKILLRFFFVYLAFQTAPWTWLDNIPGVSYITKYYYQLDDWLVHLANAKIFHVRAILVPENGSGDTSQGWASLWTYLLVAVLGCIIWSVLDRKRKNYIVLNYWLCLVARYYVALVAFSYGIIKLFCLQMVFPSLHQLATPLGDLLPMRFSWFFIGYSDPYQMFSGAMECFAGFLLLFRRTTTLGVLMATGVFLNVMMLNLCYDIPVKIFSIQMVFTCFFLMANESKRLINFFVLNKPAPLSDLYHFNYSKKWMKISRIVLKVMFVILTIGLGFYNSYSGYKSRHQPAVKSPIKNGVYIVSDFSIGKRNTPLAVTDTLRWNDVILENGTGSIATGDTTFKHRYNRAYFLYVANNSTHMMAFMKKMPNDSTVTAIYMQYALPDSNTVKLWGLRGKDSLFIDLKRTNRHFQLADRQFHWLSEHNR